MKNGAYIQMRWNELRHRIAHLYLCRIGKHAWVYPGAGWGPGGQPIECVYCHMLKDHQPQPLAVKAWSVTRRKVLGGDMFCTLLAIYPTEAMLAYLLKSMPHLWNRFMAERCALKRGEMPKRFQC